MRTVRCRECGAEIFFGVTHQGKRTPIDAKPTTGFVIVDDEPDSPPVVSGKVYVSHFATCTNPERFRKPRNP